MKTGAEWLVIKHGCHSFDCDLCDFTDGKKQKQSCKKTCGLKCFPFGDFNNEKVAEITKILYRMSYLTTEKH